MSLPFDLSQDLVALLDTAFKHGLIPGQDVRAVCIEATQRVTQRADAYLADITLANGGSAAVPVQPAVPSSSTLPDGWEEGVSAWFLRLRRHSTSQNNARAFADHIGKILRRHSVTDYVTPQPSSSPTVPTAPTLAPVPLSKAPLRVSALNIADKPSDAGLSPPSASTPALLASSHRCLTPEDLLLATTGLSTPPPLPKESIYDLAAAEEASQSPAASSPGPVYGPYSPAPPSPCRHSTPVGFAPIADLREVPALFADGLLIDMGATEASPFLASTPALSAPPSTRVDSPPEHYGSQLATPDARSDTLALWGITSKPPRSMLDLTELDERDYPSSLPSPSSPISTGRLFSSRSSSPRCTSPPPPKRSFHTNPEIAQHVAAHCQTFRDLVALSHICHDVRMVLIAAPELWTDVQVVSTPEHAVFGQLLARSQQRVIRINIVVKKLPHFPQVVLALSAVASRTKHLAVSFSRPWAVARRTLRRLVESPAPELQSLELRFNTDGRPESFFGGSHQITSLVCQIWQIEKVDASHLNSVREFVVLPPPPKVDQWSHSATNVFWLLRNLEILVLDRAFNEKRRMKKKYYPTDLRPLTWLVLDQRTGSQNWDSTMTEATLRRTRLQDIESVVLVHPLATTAKLVWAGLRDTPPDQLALLPLDGQVHVASICQNPHRARFLLDVPEYALHSLDFPGFFIVHLTLALHMPSGVMQHFTNKHLFNMNTLTLWLNPAGDGLRPLLTTRSVRLSIGTALREIRLVAEFPRLPDVCHRYLADPPQRAPRTIAAERLSEFFDNQFWTTSSVTLMLGDGVGLVGRRSTLADLLGRVKSIERIG